MCQLWNEVGSSGLGCRERPGKTLVLQISTGPWSLTRARLTNAEAIALRETRARGGGNDIMAWSMRW